MKMYIAVPIRDVQKAITGYLVKQQVDQPFKPKGDYEILKGIDTKFPKAIQVGKEWEVVEDIVKKEEKETEEALLKQDAKDLKDADFDTLTLAQLRTVVKKLAKLALVK